VKVFSSLGELRDAVGTVLGPGEWHQVEQAQVDLFAEATGDRQWIHVDPERAAAGPYGGTVAHGFLTLSLLPVLVRGLYRIEGVGLAVNYGLGKVRFPAPVRTGTAVRASVELRDVADVGGGVQLVSLVTVESSSAAKPCCVAEALTRFYPAEEVT